MSEVVIGSRGSLLARRQALWVQGRLQDAHPGMPVRLEIITTSGDRLSRQGRISSTDLKGLFVKEIEEALLDGRIDLAVHSLKDLPNDLPPGLTIAAVPLREDPRDAMICRAGHSSWKDLRPSARIATGSLRRRVQLAELRPDIVVEDIQGNVDTRIRRMDERRLDGLILAAAGLKRMGQESRIDSFFSLDEMVPAVGQGALALETRIDDATLRQRLLLIDHSSSAACAGAERAFLARMGGGCRLPMGGHARLIDGQAFFTACLGPPQGGPILRARQQGSPQELTDLALSCAQSLLEQGAAALLS